MALDFSVIDVTSLRLLSTIDAGGSISAAARMCSMSQPSASVRLRKLEQAIGAALIRKTPRGSSLTPAGRRILEAALPILSAVDDLEEAVVATRQDSREVVHIAASYTIGDHLLNSWLEASHLFEQGLVLELRVGNAQSVCDLVLDGSADVGFMGGIPTPQDLDSHVVARDELLVVVAPTHPWARVSSITLEELGHTPLIMREGGSGTKSFVWRQLETHLGSRPPDSLRELGSTTAVKGAVIAGLGASIISNLTIATELDEGKLVRVKVDGPRFVRDLKAVVLRGTEPTSVVRHLIGIAQRISLAPPVPAS